MNNSPSLRFFRHRLPSLLLLLTIGLAGISAGGQLRQARVSQVVKDVKLLPAQAAPRPAILSDEVRDNTAVRTGVESRAELTFTDQTLARLDANTIFSFNEGTRNLELAAAPCSCACRRIPAVLRSTPRPSQQRSPAPP